MKGSRPLTDAEVAAVAGKLSPRDRAMFILGVRTGFRISEILSLRVEDVLQPDGTIVDRVSVQRRNMKGKTSGRTVVLHQEARGILAVLANGLSGMQDAFLFTTKIGTRVSRFGAAKALAKAYREAGVHGKLGTHAMRKTFANRVYERLGRDLVKTQAALGHANVGSTASYISFAQSDVDAAILETL